MGRVRRSGRSGSSGSLALVLVLLAGCGGGDRPPGDVRGPTRDAALRRGQEAAQAQLRDQLDAGAKRILFGDLHVHTTYSIDAFVYALPFFGGSGSHPPADACDFARHCAALDFFSINDHAEALTPERWRATQENIRECNARAGDPDDPDLVAYVGWEWTQAGPTPESHFGHKNVIFPGLAAEELPARPITSLPDGSMARARGMTAVRALGRLPGLGLRDYADFLWWVQRMTEVPDCEAGVDSRALPADCRENAPTPELLFEKLAQWGLESLVIPHGLAWGIHAPPGSRLDVQLRADRHDPARQRLLEVFSGHGNSEVYRPWSEAEMGGEEGFCPEPTPDYLPCCWQAGEILRARCGDLPAEECEARVREARLLAARAGSEPQLVLPDAPPEAWLDCDQCRDCFKPASVLRPRQSAQYALALSAFDGPRASPQRFRFGFVASSDNHSARPGTGYKQTGRRGMTDARGVASRWSDRLSRGWIRGGSEDPRRAQAPTRPARSLRGLLDTERGASFLYPGGLVAAHVAGRSREAIWEALHRREVYGTSGPRILLWFDLLDEAGRRRPMGSELELAASPRFEVRAAGAFVQRPGCPEASRAALGDERLAALCLGECYHPGEGRHAIERIEIVRIRPQQHAGEAVEPLIEDPWRSFDCAPASPTCRVAFEDPDFLASAREAIYYARVLQEPTPAINGANLRTSFDAEGRAVAVRPCHAGHRADPQDDCLAPVRERAWSSPIFVQPASPPVPPPASGPDAAAGPARPARGLAASSLELGPRQP